MNDKKVLDANELYNYILTKIKNYRSSSAVQSDGFSFGMILLDYIEKHQKPIKEFIGEDK